MVCDFCAGRRAYSCCCFVADIEGTAAAALFLPVGGTPIPLLFALALALLLLLLLWRRNFGDHDYFSPFPPFFLSLLLN